MPKTQKRAEPKTFDPGSAKEWLRAARSAEGVEGFLAFYEAGVSLVAQLLRPRFESGELRGWQEGDEDKYGTQSDRTPPPLWRVEAACQRLFIATPFHALVVLHHSSPKARRAGIFDWKDHAGGDCLQLAAKEVMAADVIAFAKRSGWLKRNAARAA